MQKSRAQTHFFVKLWVISFEFCSHYSEDEASDISLDELTDEEPEDLRTTLNKSKKNTVSNDAVFFSLAELRCTIASRGNFIFI